MLGFCCHTNVWEILTSIGTLSAVLVSLIVLLFGETIKRKINYPKISLTVNDDMKPENVTNVKGEKRIYLHLKLVSKNKIPIKNVEVLITKISKKDNEVLKDLYIGEIPLYYSYYISGQYIVNETVDKIYDFIYVSESNNIQINSVYLPNDFEKLNVFLPNINYIFEIKVRHSCGVSKINRFNFKWNGTWPNDGQSFHDTIEFIKI